MATYIQLLNFTMIEELTNFWHREFENFSPEAHNLKHEYKDRWVRFHSLPESKRYPENEDEYSEVFRRHNTVLLELCGNVSKVLVVLPEYSEERVPTQPEPTLVKISGPVNLGAQWHNMKMTTIMNRIGTFT